ncbi:hypothetical protein IAU60_006238 [Kwoniella sp. DSM 27419]
MKVKTKRNRKIPISSATTAGSARGPAVSHRVTQSTIAQFHTLLKRQAALKSKLKGCSSDGSVAALQDDLSRIEKEMEELGGLEAYQEASKLGQSRERGGDSSKVLVQWLVEMGMKTSTIKGKGKLRMLEIGALTPDNYAACSSWIQNHPIDLNSQHPSIKQQDFFERPLPTSEEERFDLISCSLVLNFVNSPAERGRMLSLIHSQLRPSTSSLLYLVLPLPCLTNSRYLSVKSFAELMTTIGFRLEKEKWRQGGKVGYWLWSWQIPPQQSETARTRWGRKVIETDGPKRNNFAVILA